MPKKPKHNPTAAQTSFEVLQGWGGKRRGAGRKNKTRQVGHMKRDTVNPKTPLHLTLKIRDAKWNLRCGEVAAAFKASGEGAKKFGLFILHYSIQRDHLHLLVETRDNESLGRGMRSFGSRFGKAIRRLIGGRGSVFSGRYHLTVIRNPTQMRNALAYVLQNFAKHARLLKHIDAFSSAPYFAQWRMLLGRDAGPILESLGRSVERGLPPHLCAARSWLARDGWMRARKASAG